jgi:methyl-accepting chemotaxis protein
MNKRRNYFIDKKFQANFIVKFCLLVAATGSLIMAALYLLTRKATTVSFVNSRVVVQSTADFIFPVLIQTFLVTMVLLSLATIFFTLLLSHRIAGPAFRFKKVLKALAEGDFCGECRIRKGDSLQDVAAAINSVMENARGVLKETGSRISALKESVKNAADRTGADDLKKAVSELEKTFRYFKF